MMQLNLNIMKEETLKQIADSVNETNVYLKSIARKEKFDITSFKTVQDIVQAELAKKYFSVGDQFILPWTDIVSGKTYDWPWHINDFLECELPDGSIVPGMMIQADYASPFSIQFDHEENEVATESTFTSGYYYYTKNDDNSYKLNDVTYGDAIPSDTIYYHSAIKDTTGNICRCGYNRWSHSAYRQYLNSAKGKGEWWTPQHLGDVAPSQLNSYAGFLSGFEQDFLDVIGPVKVTTVLNTVTDSDLGDREDTFDTMFLLSIEEMYGSPQLAGVEGAALEYWKQATGLTAPSNGANQGRITYALENQTSARYVRLRSANRGYSYLTWFVYTAGAVGYNGAYSSYGCAPACIIH
jgi:hypothetical protein